MALLALDDVTTAPMAPTEFMAAFQHKSISGFVSGPPFAQIAIVDGTFKLPGLTPTGPEEYATRHIPGAVYFDVDAVSDHANPLPHMFPSAAQFGRDVDHRVGEDSLVCAAIEEVALRRHGFVLLLVMGHELLLL